MLRSVWRFSILFLGYPVRSHVNDVQFVEGDDKKIYGFSQFYNDRIKPGALQAEAVRVKYLKQLIFRSRIVMLGIIILGFSLFYFSPYVVLPSSDICSYIYAFFSTMVAGWLYYSIASYKAQIKSNLFREVFKFFGDYSYVPQGENSLGRYKNFGIIPTHDFYKSEDVVSGKHKDVSLRIEELKLQRRGKRNSRCTVFKGAVILLGFNKNFNGRVIVKRDFGKILNFATKWFDSDLRDLQRVTLEDPEFEKTFEVYATDQIEARYLLTTAFMERLKQLAEVFGCKKIEASFFQQELFLTFNGSSDLFEPGSIFKEINLVEECHRLIGQMNLIFDIIEILKLDQKTRL